MWPNARVEVVPSGKLLLPCCCIYHMYPGSGVVLDCIDS